MSDSISVVSATPADCHRLADFLAVHFFPCEPLNLAMNEAVGKLVYPVTLDLEYVLGYLLRCLSLMAVEGGDVIGVAVGREITSEDPVARAEIIANVKAVEDKVLDPDVVFVGGDLVIEGCPYQSVPFQRQEGTTLWKILQGKSEVFFIRRVHFVNHYIDGIVKRLVRVKVGSKKLS